MPKSESPGEARQAGAGTSAGRGLDWLPRIASGDRVKYAQVIEAIEAAVSSGRLPPGERLPSHRELATHLGVTIATLSKAIGEMRRRGRLVARQGAGTFIAGPPVDISDAASRPGPLDLALNRPPVAPVATLLGRELAAMAAQPSAAEALGYEPIGGALPARSDGAAWLRLRDLPVSTERVLLTQGTHEGLLVALMAVTRPGDRVLCEALNYTGLRRIASLLQIELVGVPVAPAGLDVEAFARLCRDGTARAAVLTPVTQNPTTATLGAAERRAVLAAARAAGMIVIEDDIYGHLADDRAPLLGRLEPDGVIVVTSLSKSVAAGLRLGYVVAPPQLGLRVQESLYALGWTAPALHTSLVARLIATGAAEACVRAQRAEALERGRLARERLGAALRPAGAVATYHVWLPLPERWHAEDFAAELLMQDLRVSPAYHFVHGGGLAPAAVRLSLGAVEDRAALLTALERIAAMLACGRPGRGAIV